MLLAAISFPGVSRDTVLLLVGVALFGIFGAVFVLWARKYAATRQNATAEQSESRNAKQRAYSMERRLAQAEQARRDNERRGVRNNGRELRIAAVCANFPDIAQPLRVILRQTPHLGNEEVSKAVAAAQQAMRQAQKITPAATRADAADRGPTEIPVAQREDIHAALRLLAGADDGTVTQDKIGFNRDHSMVGRRLALKDSLTATEADVGRDLIRFYRRQLLQRNAALFERAVAGAPAGLRDLTSAALESRLAAPAQGNDAPLLQGPPSAGRRVNRALA